MCGVYIEAIYRPLPTIYNPTKTNSYFGAAKPENAFDYVDPQFYPCSRSFPANGVPGEQNGFVLQDLITRTPTAVPNANGSAILVTETWIEFTIRRVMCPSVPWETIRQFQNRINGQAAWTPANMTIPGLPKNTFPQGTVRFDTAEVVKRTMPDPFDAAGKLLTNTAGGPAVPVTQSMTWWDITYKFSWRTTYDMWVGYGGFWGQQTHGPEYIPWNCDWYMGCDQGLIVGLLGGTLLPGWYEMTFEQPTNVVISFNTRRKYLDVNADQAHGGTSLWGSLVQPANHPFNTLFLRNAP